MVVRDENGNKVDINQTSTTQLYERKFFKISTFKVSIYHNLSQLLSTDHVRASNRIRRATVSFKVIYSIFISTFFCSLNLTKIEHQSK